MPEVQVKRIYQKPSPDDGVRLLVDRLWPRGVSREAAQIDHWAKALTPSHELRKWFHAHPDQHADFANRYQLELNARLDDITELFASIDAPRLTMVTSTKDLERGHVAILKDFLEALRVIAGKKLPLHVQHLILEPARFPVRVVGLPVECQPTF